MNHLLYYDFEPDGAKRPLWLSVSSYDVNWEESTFYVDCSSYDMCDIHDFYDNVYGLSIFLDELVINEIPNHFGIDIDRVKKRLGGQIDFNEIESFMIQVVDVVEVLEITL